MDRLDTYTLEMIILNNKYLDLESVVKLIDNYKDIRENIFKDIYLIKIIVKMLFNKKGINIYDYQKDVNISQLLNTGNTEINLLLYNSLSKFRKVNWEQLYYDNSYIGFLIKLYNMPKYNTIEHCLCCKDEYNI